MDLVTAYNGSLIRIGLYLFIFWPTVGYYVYSDAEKRGLGNPQLRGVTLGLLGILGLLIHLAMVQRQTDQ
jgi:hypothetical protein